MAELRLEQHNIYGSAFWDRSQLLTAMIDGAGRLSVYGINIPEYCLR